MGAAAFLLRTNAYVIQTLIPVIQTINLDLVAQQDTASLRNALASDMDIGNVVLASLEERFMEKHINTIIDRDNAAQVFFEIKFDHRARRNIVMIIICALRELYPNVHIFLLCYFLQQVKVATLSFCMNSVTKNGDVGK